VALQQAAPRETILPNFYQIGVLSLPVVALTGTFIGMVLAVQSYSQFQQIGMETRLGAVINMSLVRELGPVLAATMLAGRVGSAMAAELGTMRVTEQIDALTSMGANPIHYLVVPRFLGCLLLIPGPDDHGRLHGRGRRLLLQRLHTGRSTRTITWRTRAASSATSTCSPGVQELFFGAAIALIACHRGFNCDPGAEGVGRAATAAFVYFVRVDPGHRPVLGIVLDTYLLSLGAIWPESRGARICALAL
jgi:phospholipid/cholesterol/gamma-HCH transport system permease protein